MGEKVYLLEGIVAWAINKIKIELHILQHRDSIYLIDYESKYLNNTVSKQR